MRFVYLLYVFNIYETTSCSISHPISCWFHSTRSFGCYANTLDRIAVLKTSVVVSPIYDGVAWHVIDNSFLTGVLSNLTEHISHFRITYLLCVSFFIFTHKLLGRTAPISTFEATSHSFRPSFSDNWWWYWNRKATWRWLCQKIDYVMIAD